MSNLSEVLPEELANDPAFAEIPDVETLAKSYHERVNAQPPGLHDMLPEDLREDPALKDFKDVGGLAKSFKDTQQHLGNAIRVPGEDASEEERKEFYQKLVEKAPGVMPKPDFDNPVQAQEFYRSLGMPEKAEEYELPEVEGIELDDDRIGFLRSVAHKVGVTKSQFHDFMHEVLKQDAEALSAKKSDHEKSMAELKQDWGHAFDERATMAEKAREQFFPFIPKEEMGAETMKALYSVAEQLGGELAQLNRQEGDTGKITPAEAQSQIGEIMRNRQHPYWNPSDPGHEDAVQRMVELHKLANPSASTSIDDLRAGGTPQVRTG